MPHHPRAADVAEHFLRLLADEGLPPPDQVEFREDELVFLYREQKLAVVVALDGEEAGGQAAARDPGRPVAATPPDP